MRSDVLPLAICVVSKLNGSKATALAGSASSNQTISLGSTEGRGAVASVHVATPIASSHASPPSTAMVSAVMFFAAVMPSAVASTSRRVHFAFCGMTPAEVCAAVGVMRLSPHDARYCEMPSLHVTRIWRGGLHGLLSAWSTSVSPGATLIEVAPVKDHVRVAVDAAKCNASEPVATCVLSNAAAPDAIAFGGGASSTHVVRSDVDAGGTAVPIAVHDVSAS